MLVLARDNREKLHLETDQGEVVNIHITDSSGHQIRIAFNAPKSCCILREEWIRFNAISANKLN